MAELPEGLPNKIKIGYADYALEAWETRPAMAARRYGETAHLEQIIRVEFGYGRKTANTLLHEIMHAISILCTLEDGMTEEAFVTNCANGLTTVWRDNPAIFAWIGKELVDG